MITLNVPDMHCQMCVKRISEAFQEADVTCTIDLDSHSVSVDPAKVELAISELEDLGFDATPV